MKLLSGRFPNDGLRYPKTVEKPPFQTRREIERHLTGGLTAAEQARLWDALYLPVGEIAELLQFVKTAATQPFVYPMVCFVAQTGARRLELLRLKVADIDLAGKTATVHEKKRVLGKTTTRCVPLSPFLVGVLQDWLAEHPGSSFLFAQATTVPRSKTRSATTGHQGPKTRPKTQTGRAATVSARPTVPASPLTPREAHDHFPTNLGQCQ